MTYCILSVLMFSLGCLAGRASVGMIADDPHDAADTERQLRALEAELAAECTKWPPRYFPPYHDVERFYGEEAD